jgi:hypothetical protein
MRANNKIRFIRAVITGELKVSNRKRADIEADLEAQGYDKMAKSKDVSGWGGRLTELTNEWPRARMWVGGTSLWGGGQARAR